MCTSFTHNIDSLMFDDHDLDERYQSDYDHSITYERGLHAYDDP